MIAQPAHAVRRLLGLLVFAGAALAVGATPASATDEFPSEPTAVATLACVEAEPVGGPVLTLELGNTGGLSSAHFAVARTDVPDLAYDVAAGATTIVTYQDLLPENYVRTITGTADHGFSYTETFTIDCTAFVGELALACDGLQPSVTGTATAIGELGDEIFLDDDAFNTLDTRHLAAGETGTVSAQVPNDVPFTVDLDSDSDGTLATLTATPHCELHPVPTTTTVPEPAPSSTTTSTTVAATGAPTPPATRALQVDRPLPATVPTELPRTGSNSLPLALAGMTLVGLGALLHRKSRIEHR
ncbi:hypothetical protein BH10ACT1_BH10ACT1_27060 [soil metagenome]